MTQFIHPHAVLKRIILPLLGVVCLFQAKAQEVAAESIFTDDLFISEVNPLHAFGIFTFNTPFYIGNFKTKRDQLSVGYSFGNTWHPQSTVYYPQNLTAAQQLAVNSLYVTDRPQYFAEQGIATQQKTFATDGVLQNLSLSYLLNRTKIGSFIFRLNTFTLSGGTSPFYYLASDRFIEKIHSWVGLEDNFGRKLFPFNQSNILYQDENGRKIQISGAQTFLGTLDVNYYRSIWQKESASSLVTFQGGAHFTLPLNSYYPKVAGGLSASFLFRRKFLPRFYTDLALDGSVSNYALASLGNAPLLIDRDLRISAKSYLAFNFISKRSRTVSFGLVCNYQDSFLKGNIFNYTQDNYRDLGVSYLKAGDIWEGTTLNKTPRLSKLTAASMYYFSLKPYFFWGLTGKKTSFIFTICEDYPLVNNAPDIQYGFQLSRRMGW